MANKIEPGDMLAFYVTGKKQFAAIARVKSNVVEEHTRIWQSNKKPQEMYPYRVQIEPVLTPDEDQWPDAEPYHERFTWTQRWPRQNWTLAYQGNLHEIPEEDFKLLQSDMQRVSKAAAR